MKKYSIKELVKNTDFEAQRRDPELQAWNNKQIVKCEDLDSIPCGRKADYIFIDDLEVNESVCYSNFSIKKLEKAMSEKSETMPKISNFEELNVWLDGDEDNG